jgi:hypothetical protein
MAKAGEGTLISFGSLVLKFRAVIPNNVLFEHPKVLTDDGFLVQITVSEVRCALWLSCWC